MSTYFLAVSASTAVSSAFEILLSFRPGRQRRFPASCPFIVIRPTRYLSLEIIWLFLSIAIDVSPLLYASWYSCGYPARVGPSHSVDLLSNERSDIERLCFLIARYLTRVKLLKSLFLQKAIQKQNKHGSKTCMEVTSDYSRKPPGLQRLQRGLSARDISLTRGHIRRRFLQRWRRCSPLPRPSFHFRVFSFALLYREPFEFARCFTGICPLAPISSQILTLAGIF